MPEGQLKISSGYDRGDWLFLNKHMIFVRRGSGGCHVNVEWMSDGRCLSVTFLDQNILRMGVEFKPDKNRFGIEVGLQ